MNSPEDQRKLDEDLIIEQDKELYEKLKDELTCIICFGLLQDPLICSRCETVFCKSCIDTWFTKREKCPLNCSKTDTQLSQIPKNMKKLMNKIRVKCPNDCQVELLDYGIHVSNCAKESPIKCWNCGHQEIGLYLKEKVNNL